MRIELNTDICPIVVPDTYGSGLCYEVADDCWDDFKRDLAELTGQYIKDAIKDTSDFKGCAVTVDKNLKSPQFYNYGTDWVDFYIEISDDLVEQLKGKVNNDFLGYIRKFGSRSGFVSFYPTDEKEVEKAFESNPDSDKFALLIAEFIMWEVEKETNLDKYQDDFMMDAFEIIGQNGYEDYDDDEFDESKKVKKALHRILEGKDIRRTLAESSSQEKYELMNKAINKIIKMDAQDFVNKYIDTSRIDFVQSDIESGFVPFRMEDNEMMELSLNDGRLEYDGTSMGGSREFYFKVKEIADILKRLCED